MTDLLPEEGAIDLPEKGGGTYRVHAWEIDGWQKSEMWGHLRVRAEIQKMYQWLMANPRKRKVATKKFIVNWLNRAAAEGATSARPADASSAAQAAYRARVQREHHEQMSLPAARPEVARAALDEAMRILRG